MPRSRGLFVLVAIALVGFAGAALAQDDNPRRVANVSLADEGCPQGPDRFCAQPSTITLEEGTDLVLRVINEGRIAHNLTFPEEASAELRAHGMNGTLAPDGTQRLEIPWEAFAEGLGDDEANATLHCGLDGHAALGEQIRVQIPSLAAGDERPQPGPGAALALGVVAIAALVGRRG